MRTWIAICIWARRPSDHISNKSVGKDQSSVRSVSCRFVRFCPQITFSICRLNLTVAERGQQEGGIFWWIGQVKEVERSVDLCLGRKSDNFGKSCNFRTRRGRADVTGGDGPTSQYLGNRPISNFCKFARHFRSSNQMRTGRLVKTRKSLSAETQDHDLKSPKKLFPINQKLIPSQLCLHFIGIHWTEPVVPCIGV